MLGPISCPSRPKTRTVRPKETFLHPSVTSFDELDWERGQTGWMRGNAWVLFEETSNRMGQPLKTSLEVDPNLQRWLR
jgi:hypothetical protein